MNSCLLNNLTLVTLLCSKGVFFISIRKLAAQILYADSCYISACDLCYLNVVESDAPLRRSIRISNEILVGKWASVWVARLSRAATVMQLPHLAEEDVVL